MRKNMTVLKIRMVHPRQGMWHNCKSMVLDTLREWDSAVFSTLKKEVKSYEFTITKEECANHAIKCFLSALENLPQYKGRNKLTEAQWKWLATAVRCAVAMRSKQVENNELEAAKQLQEDIWIQHYTALATTLM